MLVWADVCARRAPSRGAVDDHALGIPADAGPSLEVAFHVRAFLQVPNYLEGEIQNARYAPNERVLLRDLWDNNDGRDYTLPIQ